MKILTGFIILCSLVVQAAPSTDSMSGYTMNQFGDFTKNWELVTIRFRKDSGEMRFTYANKMAWDVLQKNDIHYPDGAVFAKLSIVTKDDPAFPSSAVPSGTRRVQFMVKDKKKHAATEGWGYALFDSEGKTYPGDTSTAALACAACHRAVPDRGYVFSQPMKIPAFANHKFATWEERFVFKKINRDQLPKNIAALIPTKYQQMSSLQGDLTQNAFAGTLDEIRPLLTKESLRSQMPAILLTHNGPLFSVVFESEQKNCAPTEKSMKGVHSLPNKKTNFEIDFCAGKDS